MSFTLWIVIAGATHKEAASRADLRWQDCICNTRAVWALRLHSCRALSSQTRKNFSTETNDEVEQLKINNIGKKCYLCPEPRVLPMS